MALNHFAAGNGRLVQPVDVLRVDSTQPSALMEPAAEPVEGRSKGSLLLSFTDRSSLHFAQQAAHVLFIDSRMRLRKAPGEEILVLH